MEAQHERKYLIVLVETFIYLTVPNSRVLRLRNVKILNLEMTDIFLLQKRSNGFNLNPS